MHLIPCRKKSDSKVGMYDLIGKKFYELTNGKGGNPVVHQE